MQARPESFCQAKMYQAGLCDASARFRKKGEARRGVIPASVSDICPPRDKEIDGLADR